MTIRVATTRTQLRAALGEQRPGLVPTMGALHEGHLSLIARSVNECDLTVVSIFVNPIQFTDVADLQRYPRNLAGDIALAESAGAEVIFAPPVEEIYPAGFDTNVEVGELARRWEGAHRPGHFRGVATVVAVLMNLVLPAKTYFGEKDYQQLQIIRRMHADLVLPGTVVGCPTVRDHDGVAFSSRNARLSGTNRERASAIPRAIAQVLEMVAAGELDVSRLEAAGRAVLDRVGAAADYLAIVNGSTLEPLVRLQPDSRLMIAAEIGGVRLIDNVAIEP